MVVNHEQKFPARLDLPGLAQYKMLSCRDVLEFIAGVMLHMTDLLLRISDGFCRGERRVLIVESLVPAESVKARAGGSANHLPFDLADRLRADLLLGRGDEGVKAAAWATD